MSHADRFFIGGEWVEPSSDATIDVIDSGTEELYYSIAEAAARRHGPRGRGRAARRSTTGPWPRLTHAERAEYLRALGAALAERDDVLGAAVAARVGRALQASRSTPGGSASRCARVVRRAGRHVPVRGGVPRRPAAASSACSCASRSAWSARSSRGTRRSALICHKIGPALLAGCTVVLKSSPEAPGEGYVFAEAAEQIGLPPGVLNVVTADREVSELLVTRPARRQDHLHRLDRGRPAHRVALRRAHRPRARSSSAGSRPRSSSTTWTSATAATTLAERRVRPDRPGVLVAHADHRHRRTATTSWSRRSPRAFGAGARRRPVRRAVADGPARRRSASATGSLGYIAKGVDEGATLADRRRPPDGPRPRLVRGADRVRQRRQLARRSRRRRSSARCSRVIPAADEQDAVRIANDTIYGLNASVFTHDVDRARAVAGQLRSGTVGHNAFRTDFGTKSRAETRE